MISDTLQPYIHIHHLLSELLPRRLSPKLEVAPSGLVADSCVNPRKSKVSHFQPYRFALVHAHRPNSIILLNSIRYRKSELTHTLPERISKPSGFFLVFEADNKVVCVSNKPGEISGLITNTLRCGMVSHPPSFTSACYQPRVWGSVLRWWLAFPQGLDFHQLASTNLSRHACAICGLIFLDLTESSGRVKKCVHSRITREPVFILNFRCSVYRSCISPYAPASSSQYKIWTLSENPSAFIDCVATKCTNLAATEYGNLTEKFDCATYGYHAIWSRCTIRVLSTTFTSGIWSMNTESTGNRSHSRCIAGFSVA